MKKKRNFSLIIMVRPLEKWLVHWFAIICLRRTIRFLMRLDLAVVTFFEEARGIDLGQWCFFFLNSHCGGILFFSSQGHKPSFAYPYAPGGVISFSSKNVLGGFCFLQQYLGGFFNFHTKGWCFVPQISWWKIPTPPLKIPTVKINDRG